MTLRARKSRLPPADPSAVRPATSRYAVCIDNAEYRVALELHKIYRLVADDEAAQRGEVRVVDESGESCRYPAAWFTIIRVPRAVRESIDRAD